MARWFLGIGLSDVLLASYSQYRLSSGDGWMIGIASSFNKTINSFLLKPILNFVQFEKLLGLKWVLHTMDRSMSPDH